LFLQRRIGAGVNINVGHKRLLHVDCLRVVWACQGNFQVMFLRMGVLA
jgi:hypothetical protein